MGESGSSLWHLVTRMSLCPNSIFSALAILLSVGTGFPSLSAPPAKLLTKGANEGDQAAFDLAFTRKTIEALACCVETDYFDPALGAKVASSLREGLAAGRYGLARDVKTLADLLTSEMYALAKDKHLSIRVLDVPKSQQPMAAPTAAQSREERGKHENYGLQRVEILPGNVGYLRLTAFYRPVEVREVLAEAMAFLSHTDALIVDLREHGGGSTPTLGLFVSYFLGSPGEPLFELIPRPPAIPSRFLSESGKLANRDLTRPTFLLTSPRTFSGGEGVAFLLQERHRAEVIGETTGGGANQVPPSRILNSCFEVIIPNGCFRSSLTGKNWEGVGVIPDIPVPASKALPVAHSRAIQALLRVVPKGPWHEQLGRELALVEVAP